MRKEPNYGDRVVRPVIRDFLKARGFQCKKSSCSKTVHPIEVTVWIFRSRFADWYHTQLHVRALNEVCPYEMDPDNEHLFGSLEGFLGPRWKEMKVVMDGENTALSEEAKAELLRSLLDEIGPKLDAISTLDGLLDLIRFQLTSKEPLPRMQTPRYGEDLLKYQDSLRES